MERPWKCCGDLLDLFGVPACEGRERFEDLCELGALLLRFYPAFGLSPLERALMRENAWSPLVFWACQKRAIRPLLTAGGDTLRALGVKVEEEPTTVHALAVGVCMAMAADVAEDDEDAAYDIFCHIRRVNDGF